LQFAQANVRPKITKELDCFPSLFCLPEKQNQVSAKIENEEDDIPQNLILPD
jgi:hypothetical protein